MPRVLAALGACLLASAVFAQGKPAAAPLRTPAIPDVVKADMPIDLMRDGFSGTDGALPMYDGSVLFSETQTNRVIRVALDGSSTTFVDKTNGATALASTVYGAMYALHGPKQPRVTLLYPAEGAKLLADKFEGKPFGRLDDMVVGQDDTLYFTDAGTPAQPGQSAPAADAAPPAVYRLTQEGNLQRVATDIERPSGIQLSTDEKVLYVADTAGEHVLALDLGADGTVGPRRNFAKLAGWQPGGNGVSADGLAVDALGRLFVATAIGIQVFDAKGEALGVIPMPKVPQSLAFGGPQKRTLYVVGQGSVYRIRMATTGHPGRLK